MARRRTGGIQPYRKKRPRPLGTVLRAMRRGKPALGPNRGAVNRLATRKKRRKTARIPRP